MSSLKAAGQASVLANAGSWTRKGIAAISKLSDGRMFMLEGVPGIPKPRHPNAYGALATLAQKKKIMRHTGQYTASFRAAARGRAVAIYERTKCL